MTGSTSGAKIGVDLGLAPAHEIGSSTNIRLRQQVEVGGINIGIAENGTLLPGCQGRKSRGQTGFSGSSFAAYDHEFAHSSALLLLTIVAIFS
jgi:hypothetical protein